MTTHSRVAIIGLGTIGVGWATYFAYRGLEVACFDVDAGLRHKLKQRVSDNLSFLQSKGVITTSQLQSALNRCAVYETMAQAATGATYVQESVYETYEAKRNVFCQLDRLTPGTVTLASSSSGLLMTEIQSSCKKPERCLIAHPINPVFLIPLVELVPGEQTDPAVISSTREFMESIGKVPVALKKEVPGYIENRITAALWREAIDLVITGVASAEDVDRTMWAGPGLRYALMGPHMIYHLGGGEGGIRYFIDHLETAFESWWQSMQTWTEFPKKTAETLEQQLSRQLGQKTIQEQCRWRDEKLVELLQIMGHIESKK